jgi:hypothetical protein
MQEFTPFVLVVGVGAFLCRAAKSHQLISAFFPFLSTRMRVGTDQAPRPFPP